VAPPVVAPQVAAPVVAAPLVAPASGEPGTAPVDTAPVDPAPVDTAPVDTAPVDVDRTVEDRANRPPERTTASTGAPEERAPDSTIPANSSEPSVSAEPSTSEEPRTESPAAAPASDAAPSSEKRGLFSRRRPRQASDAATVDAGSVIGLAAVDAAARGTEAVEAPDPAGKAQQSPVGAEVPDPAGEAQQSPVGAVETPESADTGAVATLQTEGPVVPEGAEVPGVGGERVPAYEKAPEAPTPGPDHAGQKRGLFSRGDAGGETVAAGKVTEAAIVDAPRGAPVDGAHEIEAGVSTRTTLDPPETTVETEPVEAEPVNTVPIDAEPVDAEPVDAEPIDAEPVDAEPVDAEPVDAEPVEAASIEQVAPEPEPIDAPEPVDTTSTEPEPVDIEPEPEPRPVATTTAPPDRNRPSRSRRRVAVVAIAAMVIVAAAAVARSAMGPSAGSARSGNDRALPHSSTLVSSSFADVSQPPPDPTPSTPGTSVESGENQSDPVLFLDSDRYYLFTSGIPSNPPINVPVSTSTDFSHWTPVTDAMPVLPTWAVPGFTWAPDIHQFGNTYVLYFTAAVKKAGEECIGSASATSPTGPFNAVNTPFICQRGLGGSIDPRVFTAPDGTNWMLWKSDQNRGGAATPTMLWSQRLTPDGLALTGRPFDLMGPDEPWQGTIVEAPDMVDVNGDYWVFYSANWFNQPSYGIGAARCSGPQGPCADTSDAPLLATNAQGEGPGEGSVFEEDGAAWLLYSPVRAVGGNPPRPVEITRIGFGPNGPYLAAGGPPPPLVQLSGTPVWSAP